MKHKAADVLANAERFKRKYQELADIARRKYDELMEVARPYEKKEQVCRQLYDLLIEEEKTPGQRCREGCQRFAIGVFCAAVGFFYIYAHYQIDHRNRY